MRAVTYKINGVEVKSYSEKVALENQFHKKAETILSNVPIEKGNLSPIRQAMLNQFGYVSAKLRDRVVLEQGKFPYSTIKPDRKNFKKSLDKKNKMQYIIITERHKRKRGK